MEAERVAVLRAEETLRVELQRVERQRAAGALCVRRGLRQHQLRPSVQSSTAAALEAGAEDPRRGAGVQRLRETERCGPNGFVPGAASAQRLLPDQRLDGETFFTAAVEHDEHLSATKRMEQMCVQPVRLLRSAAPPGETSLPVPAVRKSRALVRTWTPGSAWNPLTCVRVRSSPPRIQQITNCAPSLRWVRTRRTSSESRPGLER